VVAWWCVAELRARRLAVLAKRKPASKAARKNERRQFSRDLEQERAEREREALALAKAKPPPVPPPQSAEEAEERLDEATRRCREAVQSLKECKLAARESDSYNPQVGYKAFPEVMDAEDDMFACKAAFQEAVLERCLLKMSHVTGKPRSLDSFSWRFGDGLQRNATCCEYMLRACGQDDAALAEVASEIVAVLADDKLLDAIDPKVVSKWEAALDEVV